MFSPPKYRTPNSRARIATPSTSSLPSLPADRDILEGLLPSHVSTVTKPSASANADEKKIQVKDLKYVGSYNWVESQKPTIIVPGSPPEWRNKATPYKVDPDSGVVFADQNGFRSPNAILLPLVRAVDMNDADFDWWIGKPDPKEFRIDTQLAGKRTILFNRWEKRTREAVGGMNYSTYGFSFEKSSTKPAGDCEESTGHHRIVKYDFGGLNMVVRFEVDACFPQPTTKRQMASKSQSDDHVDALTDAMSKFSLSSASGSKVQTHEDNYGLRIRQAGSYVPQSHIIELTTVSMGRRANFDWSEAYPQLFLSQTPHHFLAVHTRGRFNTVEQRKLGSPDLSQVDKTAQTALWKLRQALGVIKDIVVEHGKTGRLSLVCQKGEMKVYERSSDVSCLPEDILKRFET